jgi:hypothetical protein
VEVTKDRVEILVVEEILNKQVCHKVEVILEVVELTPADLQIQLQELDKVLVDLEIVQDQDKVPDKV